MNAVVQTNITLNFPMLEMLELFQFFIRNCVPAAGINREVSIRVNSRSVGITPNCNFSAYEFGKYLLL